MNTGVAISGWRVWSAGFGTEGLSLYSATESGFRWQAGFATQATCLRGHSAPSEYCECGIHACATLEQALQYVPAEGQVVIAGRVALWGKLFAVRNGWRAHYAYPEELYVSGGATLDAEWVARQLSALYGVPAEVVPSYDALLALV